MSNPTSPTPQNSTASEPDPFLSLHKMSTTAGLGSADYVAINGTAIATVILGLASAVALFQSNLLLLVPLAGILCGILAYIQISRSNGTQTGRLLAALGMLLSLGFGGYVAGAQIFQGSANAVEQQQVLALIDKFSTAIKSDDYAAAYALTSDEFRSKVPLSAFTDHFKLMNGVPVLGHISHIQWNGHIEFGVDEVNGQKLASTFIKIGYEKSSDAERSPVLLRKLDDRWQIGTLPEIFPPEQPAAPTVKPRALAEPAGPPVPR